MAKGAPKTRKTTPADVAGVIQVLDFLCYREYLEALFQELKRRDAGYSYMSFAEDLGFSRTNVIRLTISRHRNLSTVTAPRVADALSLKGLDRRYFLALVRYTNARQPTERETLFQELLALKSEGLPSSKDQVKLRYFSEWHHPVIREMAGLADFRSDPKWIASRLYDKVSPRQIEESLTLLEQLDLIRYDHTRGRHVRTGGDVIIDRHINNVGIARFHQKMLELARESITLVPVEERELNALTVCVSPESAQKIRMILERACEEVLKVESESGAADAIYQVNTQLFRLCRGDKPRRGGRPHAAK